MESIWARAQEKQALELAARRLLAHRRNGFAWKFSLSAALGLLLALWPVAGAARGFC